MPLLANYHPQTGICIQENQPTSLADFIKNIGKGGGVAYTAMRGFVTVNEKVPGSHHEMATEWSWGFLDWHIERLIESAIGIKNKRFDQHVRKDALLLQQDLRNAIVFSITNLLSHAVAALRDSTQHDLKAVLFLEIASDSYEVYAFIDSINDPFNSTLPINTLIYGSPRSNPAYKDTQWMTDRLYITEKKPDTVTEMFLHKGPLLYEGMVSNFWVLLPSSQSAPYDYILQTAPFDLVLVGIISRAIIEVAKATNIKVVFKCPDMNDISSWIGCFTTNALKGITPIRRIEDLESGTFREFNDFSSIFQLHLHVVKFSQRGTE